MGGVLEDRAVTGIERAWALASRSDTEVVIDADGHATLRGESDWMWCRRDVWAEVEAYGRALSNPQPERTDNA